MDRDAKWFSMPLSTQISNTGSEVERAIRHKDRGDEQKAANFCNKAILFFETLKQDPKNAHRIGEFNAATDELRDYFLGDNIYQTDNDTLRRYYDAFI